MAGSREFFYLDKHRKHDAELHDPIVEGGDHDAARKVSDKVARDAGLSDAEIAALQRPLRKPRSK